MAKWQFYVSRPSGNFWNPYETVEAGVFEGTQEEAQNELSERIHRTWSPYVTHSFEAAEHQMQPTDGTGSAKSALSQPENNPVSEVDTPPTISG